MTHHARLVRLTLTLGLALSLCLLPGSSHATKPLPPPPENISAKPEVKFLEPASGAKLSGAVSFRIGAGDVGQIKGWQFGTLGTTLTATQYPMGRFSYSTLGLPNGTHTFVARATYGSGAVAEGRLKVVVYNPSHQLKEINHVTYQPLDGRDAVVELTYTQPGLKLEVDLSEMDSNFDLKRVSVNEVKPGVYRIVYPISSTSTAAPGRHQVHVRAINPQGEVVPNSFEWELRKLPLMPILVTGCKFSSNDVYPLFSYETYHSIPHVTLAPQLADVVPKNVKVSGAASLELDQRTEMRVSWTAPKIGPKSPMASSDARILVTAVGRTGYYLCWVPRGAQTHATLTLLLKAPGVYSNISDGEPIPSEVRLNLTVERADYAEGWQQHAFKVTLPGAQASASVPPQGGGGVKRKRKVKVKVKVP